MANQKSLARVGYLLKAVFHEILARGGEARVREVLDALDSTLDLTSYERELLEKSGYVRWRTYVQFYSIDCVKAGYLQKEEGKWIITPTGVEALKKSDYEFIRDAQVKYREWKSAQRKQSTSADVDEESSENEQAVRQAAYEMAKDLALQEIETHIKRMGWYDFQRLVAELMVAMGYHISHVAPPGPDGGVDVIAYKDPLGMSTPRVKVQVKHREEKVNVKEVRELNGLLNSQSDMGLIVSSGGFTKDALEEVRKLPTHIETMDLGRLITLWKQYYENIRDSGKLLLPLVRLYFLTPPEE